MSGDLVDTTEMYLKAIYELEEEGVPPLRARLVERLGQSKPTVSETVARLERDGLLTIVGARTIELSVKGRKQATTVMRKHRLAERLLLDQIKVPWADIHEEACRWEHVISDDVEERIAVLLDGVTEDPFGNPIPARDALGPGDQAAGPSGLMRTVDFLKANLDGGECVIVRIGEPLQTDIPLLREFEEAGLLPGTTVTMSNEGEGWVLKGPLGSIELTPWVQGHLLVRS
ncbi:MAG: iron dependent repressor, metal binding and dimerization domain protein [Ancrocorticia sp.]